MGTGALSRRIDLSSQAALEVNLCYNGQIFTCIEFIEI